MAATARGHLEVVRLLLEAGDDKRRLLCSTEYFHVLLRNSFQPVPNYVMFLMNDGRSQAQLFN